MNWVDIVISAIVLLSAFSGLKTGLIKAAFSLAGLIAGIALAGRLYPSVAQRLPFIGQENAARVVAFILVLVVVIVAANVAAFVLTKVASAMMLGWLNSLGGAAVGFFVGVLSVAVLLALWLKFAGSPPAPITDSRWADVILNRFPAVLRLLPDQFDSIRSFFG